MKKNEIKIRMQIVFDEDCAGGTCGTGTVLAVEKDRVKIRDDAGWENYCRFDDVYADEQEYKKALLKVINDYKASIKDVNDLVRFMYNNTVSTGEYTNLEARTAVKERANKTWKKECNANDLAVYYCNRKEHGS